MSLLDEYREQVARGERDPADLAVAEMIDRDRGAWEQMLRQGAAEREHKYGLPSGSLYNDSDLEGVIRQVSYAANAGQDPRRWIDEALATYERRAASGGDRDAGGYDASPQPPSSAASSSAADWFSSNAPPPMEPYAAPERPSYLQGPYTPPSWTETFAAPSLEELLKDPGYLAAENAMQRGLERSAASRGSVLSGGFVGRTLPRALGAFTQSAYGDLYGRRLGEYTQRYGQFQDQASMGAQARSLNESAYQNDVSNALNQYNTRYRAYQDAILNNLDLARLSLNATQAGAPS